MKIAVVGTCASGKSTVVAELRRSGYAAYVVSQEHSIIARLWAHLSPDLLVVLDADYRSVCQRRGGDWPRWLYDLQLVRLRDARMNADIIVDTASLTVATTVNEIASFIEEKAHRTCETCTDNQG